METSERVAEEEAQIRAIIEDWQEAFRQKDVERMTAHYAADIRLFDLAPPLESAGLQAYRKNWQDWFPQLEGAPRHEIHDLRVTVGEGAAFAHGLARLSGRKINGQAFDLWIRLSLGFRRVEGDWKVCHEHVSVPFYMDGSFRAATDLKP